MGKRDADDTWEEKSLPSAAYWRQRAERVRRCARETRASEVQQTLLGIAKIYDSMADRAAQREARKKIATHQPGLQRASSEESLEQR